MSREQCLLSHTYLFMPHCSCLLAHASLLMPPCSYLLVHASLLIPPCSCLIAHASLLRPACSCLIAHTSWLACSLSGHASLLGSFSRILAHISLRIHHCSYPRSHTSVLILSCSYLLLIPHSSYVIAQASSVLAHTAPRLSIDAHISLCITQWSALVILHGPYFNWFVLPCPCLLAHTYLFMPHC